MDLESKQQPVGISYHDKLKNIFLSGHPLFSLYTVAQNTGHKITHFYLERIWLAIIDKSSSWWISAQSFTIDESHQLIINIWKVFYVWPS